MCKKVNRLFPLLMLFYIGGAYLIHFITAGTSVPVWLSLVESQLLVLLPAVLFVIYEKIDVLKCIPYRRLKPLDALLAILFGYMMVPTMLLLNYISMLFATNKIQETTSELIQFPFLMQILFIAVIPACVEEFVFRGIFYHSYRKNGILGSALLSGFIFGIVHLNINQFIYAFMLGVVFALLVEATGSMFASMLAHFAINTYSIIMLQLIPRALVANADSASIIRESTIATTLMAICMLGILAIAFGTIAFVIFRKLAQHNNRWEYFKDQMHRGLRKQNGERFITVPLAITLVACMAFMIITEYF